MDLSVTDIAGMTDPVLRNLCITQRYREFAVALRDAGYGEDATWCAFAVWASKTAGATIRGEMLPVKAKALQLDDDESRAAVHRFNDGLAGTPVQRLTHDQRRPAGPAPNRNPYLREVRARRQQPRSPMQAGN
jgi:hypothetical protein